MVTQDEKRSCTCGGDSSCGCDDDVSNKTSVSTHILGSTHNSIDLFLHPPNKTKWTFVEEKVEGTVSEA